MAIVIGIIFCVCTVKAFGMLVETFYELLDHLRIRKLHSERDSVTQVDALVTAQESNPKYKMTITFTGTHPSRGPFRMTHVNFCVDKETYDNYEVGDSVRICYENANPMNYEFVSCVDNARETQLQTHNAGFCVGCVYISVFWALPGGFICANLFLYHDLSGAVTIALTTLAVSALAIIWYLPFHGLRYRFALKQDKVLEYGENIELLASPAVTDAPNHRLLEGIAQPWPPSLSTNDVVEAEVVDVTM